MLLVVLLALYLVFAVLALVVLGCDLLGAIVGILGRVSAWTGESSRC